MPASPITARSAATTPSSGARGVVSVFAVKRRSPISNATSVKVPPISRPSRIAGEGAAISHRDLRPHLHHAAGRDVEEVGGVAGALGKPDEEAVLPARPAPPPVRPECAPPQEERGRHDVRDPALAARDG